MEFRRGLEEPLTFRLLIIIIVISALSLRVMVGLGSYSGEGKPPMYGDFEAQRHWMEITTSLPPEKWYVQSRENDLMYWGLDYPPLTAYFSYAWGKLAEKYHPWMVYLGSSRGIEDDETKFFMRGSALASDFLVYFPAAIAFCLTYFTQRDKAIKALALLLFQPSLILIDHGHFQYNCVSLGLALWALVFIMNGYDVLGSIAFVLSLNYKQMSLYYAPAIFFFLLGKCLYSTPNWKTAFKKLFCIGTAVIATFAVCWLPFLKSLDDLLPVVQRIFPFNRGLFEDKVANFWCAIRPVIKLKQLFSIDVLAKLSLVVTLLALVPIVVPLFKSRSKAVLLLGTAVSSMAFFLFSYQVHEKTILFPLLPITMLGIDFPSIGTFSNLVGLFSMYPLLAKDGQSVQYFCLMAFYFFICMAFSEPRRKTVLFISYFVIIAAHVAGYVIPPPARYPDIHVVINVLISFMGFMWLYMLLTVRLVRAASASPKKPISSSSSSVSSSTDAPLSTTTTTTPATTKGNIKKPKKIKTN